MAAIETRQLCYTKARDFNNSERFKNVKKDSIKSNHSTDKADVRIQRSFKI